MIDFGRKNILPIFSRDIAHYEVGKILNIYYDVAITVTVLRPL